MQRDQSSGAWQRVQTVTLDGLEVTCYEPVMILRVTGHLWFPTLIRLDSGAMVVTASIMPDMNLSVHQDVGCAFTSADGGLMWSRPWPMRGGELAFGLDDGSAVACPFYVFPDSAGSARSFTTAYTRIRPDGRGCEIEVDGTRVLGFPRDVAMMNTGAAGFVFDGQAVRAPDGIVLGTMYGTFAGDSAYSLLLLETRDEGRTWHYRSTVAGPGDFPGAVEGPCEPALVSKDGERLRVVFRVESGAPYGWAESRDGGRTWDKRVRMRDHVLSVQPSMVYMADGGLALSGGRPGVYLYLCAEGDGNEWQRVAIHEIHAQALPEMPIYVEGATLSSAYTEIVEIEPNVLLMVYDRVERSDGTGENALFVMRVEVERRG
jgi:hypothetical protein